MDWVWKTNFADQASEMQRSRSSVRHTEGDERHVLPNHAGENGSRRGAQSHPDADLESALLNP